MSHAQQKTRNQHDQDEKEFQVGNYMIGQTLGEGTFGKVKTAIHSITGEKVAVKILEKSRFKDQADTIRVNREMKILKKTRHSNIIQLYEVVDTPASLYLMMELSDQGEMFDFIVANKKLNETLACNFFHQIVNGVEELHNNFITHRDLKPENLLLKTSCQGTFLVKIVDFGLSNTHEGGKLLQTACGSPCYAAPEMIAGKKYNGPLVDIWSMGVILFTLTCGYLPFEDPNTSNLYKKILSGNYSTPRWLTAECKDLLKKILEVKPAKRYSITSIRNHSWFKQVDDNDVPLEDILVAKDPALEVKVLNEMVSRGYKKTDVLEYIEKKSYNPTSASYFLMKQKLFPKKKIDKDLVYTQNNRSPTRRNNTTAANIPAAASATAHDIISTDQQLSFQPHPAPVETVHIDLLNEGIVDKTKSYDITLTESAVSDSATTTAALKIPSNIVLSQQEHQLNQLRLFKEQQSRREDVKLVTEPVIDTITGVSESVQVDVCTSTQVGLNVGSIDLSNKIHLQSAVESTTVAAAELPPDIADKEFSTSFQSNDVRLPTPTIEKGENGINTVKGITANLNSAIVENIPKSKLTVISENITSPMNNPPRSTSSSRWKTNATSKLNDANVSKPLNNPPLSDVVKREGSSNSSISVSGTGSYKGLGKKQNKWSEKIPDIFKTTPYPALPMGNAQPSPIVINSSALKPQQPQSAQASILVPLTTVPVPMAPDAIKSSAINSSQIGGVRKGRVLKPVVHDGSNPLDKLNSKYSKLTINGEFDGVGI